MSKPPAGAGAGLQLEIVVDAPSASQSARPVPPAENVAQRAIDAVSDLTLDAATLSGPILGEALSTG